MQSATTAPAANIGDVQTGKPVNSLWLKTLLLAEITRFKYGKTMSLTNPTIERNARHQFAAMVGIKPRSTAQVYLRELKRAYTENNILQSFEDTCKRLGVDTVSL